MNIDEAKLKEILVRESYITPEDLSRAEKAAKANRTSVTDYLLSEDVITKDLLGQALAEGFGVPYADLNSNQPPREQVLKIPEAIAKNFRAVIFSENDQELTITTDNPAKKDLTVELQKLFGTITITIAYSLPEDIDISFTHYRKSLETRFSKIIEGQKRVAPEIIDQIISDAVSFHASDIHFEPQSKEVIVRFRVDGALQEAGRIAREYYENILNRIKVQSRLRIDEHFATQDGSIRYESSSIGDVEGKKDGTVVDLRTSIVPTVEGEKVVMRVLAAYVEGFNLADLGLSSMNQTILEKAAKKPFGMILVTGPTGSGKTTTLYALLKILNQTDVNITTIEDPVEYKVLGVNQIQVNSQTNLTFAHGLRSIVRQDPDIILVGEIRDNETAEIAVNAALTGHLLLSTFHANDAATAIPRLLDMDIEPFLLASTLEVIIAQRLLRKICDKCKYSIVIKQDDLGKKFSNAKHYFKEKEITLYLGKGCDNCSNTGYKGRIAIFEFIENTPEIQTLILDKPSTQEIWKLARKQGASSLFEDGIEKVKNGITTIEELVRVAPPPEDSAHY